MKISRTCLVALLSSSFFLGGCGLFQKHNDHLSFKPKSKLFKASYLEAWKAVQKTMADYPIKTNDVDKGLIVTEVIGGRNIWTPPFSKKQMSEGIHSQIKIRVIKGKYKKQESTKVVVKKDLKIKRDFFAKAEKLPTDGFEEQRILYRIKRNLILEQALDKAYQDQQNQ